MNLVNTATHDALILAAYVTAALDQLGVGTIGVGAVEADCGTYSAYARMDIEPCVGPDSWCVCVSVSSASQKEMSITGSGLPNGLEYSYTNGVSPLFDAVRQLCIDFSVAYRRHAKAQMAEAKKMMERYGKLAEEE